MTSKTLNTLPRPRVVVAHGVFALLPLISPFYSVELGR